MNRNELKDYLVSNLRLNIYVNQYKKRIEFKLTIAEDSFEDDSAKICEDWINFDDLKFE